MRVSVIGAGSWGSAVAWLLGNKGDEVRLWARNAELVEGLNTTRRNPQYLKDIELPGSVVASTNLAWVLQGAEAIVLVTPSVAVGKMAEEIAEYLGGKQLGGDNAAPGNTALNNATSSNAAFNNTSSFAVSNQATCDTAPDQAIADKETPLVLLSKGIESPTGAFLLDVLAAKLGSPDRLAVLSGPNHAEEVARGIHSATVVASQSPKTAEFFQELFATPTFRVYTSQDTTGVQLCGAAKNVVAIACGLAAGLGFGDNTTALLMTRGLAEISRLVTQLGGSPITCMGLSGMGDLVVTCTSKHSRNRAFGLELAAGRTLEDYQGRTHMVVEGAIASKTVTDLAQAYGVDMPISMLVRSIVWENEPLERAITNLIERSFKPEFY